MMIAIHYHHHCRIIITTIHLRITLQRHSAGRAAEVLRRGLSSQGIATVPTTRGCEGNEHDGLR